MADPPPPGPPPPKVPAGWKAVWNDQYSEWFFVNTYTKVSQWDKPTEPAVDPNASAAPPSNAPPAYLPSSTNTVIENEKKNPNNPYNSDAKSNTTDSDAALAAKLQAEENSRNSSSRPLSGSAAAGTRGASDSYYGQTSPGGYNQGQQQYGQQQYGQQQPQYPSQQSFGGAQGYQPQVAQSSGAKKGFLGKLLGKSSSSTQQQHGYGQQYPPQGQYYGQGYPPQQGYQQQYMQQERRHGGGGGMGAGGMMLGAGAGLVGGALLMNAFDDHEQFEQQQAYEQGEEDGYDQGYDAGGGDDMGGGDF